MNELKVKDMRPYEDRIKSVNYSTPICEAAKKLMSVPKGVVLVRENEDSLPTGIITAREFLIHTIKNNGDLRKSSSKEIMNTDIMIIKNDSSLEEAVWKITERDPYAVIVLDENEKYEGYISPRIYQEARDKLVANGIDVPAAGCENCKDFVPKQSALTDGQILATLFSQDT